MAIRGTEHGYLAEAAAEQAADISAEQLEQIVQQLNGVCRTSSLEFALKIGAVIIHHFYGGDMQTWRERGPKVNSFRRLAQHPELALSAGALYRCVAIFEMCERLRAASRWRRLGASHLRAAIGIPPVKQEDLLNRANQERWSVQMIQAQARELREGRTRGGRRARSTLGRRLSTLDRFLEDWEGLDHAGSYELDELERGLDLLEKMRARVNALVEAVKGVCLRHACMTSGADPGYGGPRESGAACQTGVISSASGNPARAALPRSRGSSTRAQ